MADLYVSSQESVSVADKTRDLGAGCGAVIDAAFGYPRVAREVSRICDIGKGCSATLYDLLDGCYHKYALNSQCVHLHRGGF
jgi:hypothetical protein